MAACGNVWCKISGLLTEAQPARRSDADIRPFVEHVVDQFGAPRLMFGSDWPVLTLAGSFQDWHAFTCRLTESWSREDRRRFYHDNANHFYGLGY
jgi:L-fuconolactonase